MILVFCSSVYSVERQRTECLPSFVFLVTGDFANALVEGRIVPRKQKMYGSNRLRPPAPTILKRKTYNGRTEIVLLGDARTYIIFREFSVWVGTKNTKPQRLLKEETRTISRRNNDLLLTLQDDGSVRVKKIDYTDPKFPEIESLDLVVKSMLNPSERVQPVQVENVFSVAEWNKAETIKVMRGDFANLPGGWHLEFTADGTITAFKASARAFLVVGEESRLQYRDESANFFLQKEGFVYAETFDEDGVGVKVKVEIR